MNAILDIVNRLGPQRLVAMGAVTLALIGFFAFLMVKISTPPMALLFSDLPATDANTIIRDLETKGVKYEIRADGHTIMVPRDQVLRMRMDYAAKGIPAGGTVGYEIFDKSDSFSATSFVQGINQLRALEGELARTIRSLDRIQQARVHLAISEKKLFQRETQEPRASIVLKVGGELDAGQIRSIRHLVANSVQGLKPERVSIVDEAGRLLADGATNDMDAAAMAQDKQSGYEKRLRGQVEEIVASIVGRGRARVQVAADMDFNRIQQVTDDFDPEKRVVRSTQTRSENQQSVEARDGQVSVANELPQNNQNQSSPQQRDNTARTEEVVNYEISKTTRTEVIEAGRVKRLSVAVLVDGLYIPGANGEMSYQPRTPEELDRIGALVRSSIGFDRNRGDQIEVVNLRFAEGVAQVEGKALTFTEQMLALTKEDVLRLVELTIFGVLTLLVTLLVVRPLLRQMGVGGGSGGSVALTQAGGGAVLALPAPTVQEVQPGPSLSAPSNAQSQIALIAQNMQPGVIDQLGKFVQSNSTESVAIMRQLITQ